MLIALYAVAVLVIAWLVALPLWNGAGLLSPWFGLTALVMMMTPAVVAVVIVVFIERPRQKMVALGLRPIRPWRRTLGYASLGLTGMLVLCVVALGAGTLIGVYPGDFTGLSELRANTAVGNGESVWPLVLTQFGVIILASFVNLLPALGEEIGWRGWLLPKLLPSGIVPAVLLSGVLWGAWHAPLLLLGYNYPGTPGWMAVLLMIGMCTIMGSLLGWLRVRSGSVWPPALAHGGLNAAASGTLYLFAADGATVDTTQATILGWSGWIVPAVLLVALIASGSFRSPAAATRSDIDTNERTHHVA